MNLTSNKIPVDFRNEHLTLHLFDVANANLVSPVLAKLIRFEALDVESEFFICTSRGHDLLTSIEEAAEVSLVP